MLRNDKTTNAIALENDNYATGANVSSFNINGKSGHPMGINWEVHYCEGEDDFKTN